MGSWRAIGRSTRPGSRPELREEGRARLQPLQLLISSLSSRDDRAPSRSELRQAPLLGSASDTVLRVLTCSCSCGPCCVLCCAAQVAPHCIACTPSVRLRNHLHLYMEVADLSLAVAEQLMVRDTEDEACGVFNYARPHVASNTVYKRNRSG